MYMKEVEPVLATLKPLAVKEREVMWEKVPPVSLTERPLAPWSRPQENKPEVEFQRSLSLVELEQPLVPLVGKAVPKYLEALT